MEKFTFDVRYYRGHAHPKTRDRLDKPSSGMYMFVANMSDFGGMSTRYTQVRECKVYQGKIVRQMTMTMRGDKYPNLATAKVRLLNSGDFNEDIMHWEVIVHGANPREASNEITVNFLAHNLNNRGGVFWTDSNGMKMMRRQLNHRDSFKQQSPQKTAANFFPVTSALAIVDPDSMLQMVVMTADRAMAGSVLRTGRVELLVNRRVDGDDQRGVFEHLVETNNANKPVHVHSEFGVHIFNKRHERSLQR
jgi:hypothetical protein